MGRRPRSPHRHRFARLLLTMAWPWLAGCLGDGASPPLGWDAGQAGASASAFSDCRVGPVEPLRIAPMGDSITQAFTSRLSYRYFLWEALSQTGAQVDFIGTQFQHYGGTRPYPDPYFDRDHEGHWGESAVEFSALFPERRWLVPADVALVHLGTNDTFSYAAPVELQALDEAISALEGLVAQLRARNPNMRIHLAQILPVGRPLQNLLVTELNRRIAALAERTTTSASPVVVVDMNSGFDPAHHLYDGLHPNEAGERLVAERWLAGLLPLLPAHRPCSL